MYQILIIMARHGYTPDPPATSSQVVSFATEAEAELAQKRLAQAPTNLFAIQVVQLY